MCGEKEPEVVSPSVPSAPSYSSTIQDYIKNYPDIYKLMEEYAPKQALLQKQTYENLYPNQAGLGEQLGGIASQGMTADAPDWYTQKTRDQLKSTFGRNLVYNPQAQEQYGTGMQQAAYDWQKYYQQMGLSLAGKTPVYGADTSMTQSYTPSQTAQYASNNYGNYLGAWGQVNPAYTRGGGGYNMAGGLGGMGAGALAGGYVGSIVPGIGTMVGAGIGGMAGAMGGFR